MTKSIPTAVKSSRRRQPGGRALPAFVAFMSTLLALPVNAVTFPDNPVQTGAAYPPPNIRFILDDSGSMAFTFMPGANSSSEVPATSPDKIQLQAYTRNTLYYNPNIAYQAWLQWDGSRPAGGTDYTKVYDDDTQMSGSKNLSNGTSTFYVPKADATDLADSRQYDRYDIKKVSGTTRVIKTSTSTLASWQNQDISSKSWWYQSITVPTGVTSLVITASDGSGGDADLYVKRGGKPTGGSDEYKSTTNSNNESVTIDDPASGTWWIGVYNYSNNNKVNDEDIVALTGSSAYATPTGRLEADEIKNFATWYSYYRTRSKMAKAAASEAFGQLGSNVRVGYDSIWNRKPYDIPVGTNGGKFTGDNRKDWFDHLQSANANNGTPLKGALQRAGKYFEDGGSSGPWGPESGTNQLSCRQNFAILTTDGYWNDNTGYSDPVGDSDASDGTKYTSADGKSTGQYKAEAPYSDKNGNAKSGTYSNTLADVANYYWKRDLRNLPNNVPTSSADPAFWQHMTTFSLAIGQSGTLDPETDLVSIKNGSKYWPKPSDDKPETIDDLWHAAVNGHGTFVAANDPTKFARGLVNALATVAARNGSASNVTANSTSFQSDTFVYQASYVSGSWIGELAAYAASSAGVAKDSEGNPLATWKASTKIPTTKRGVYTYGTGSKPVVFPNDDQIAKLGRSGGLAPVTATDNAAYLKGDQSKERQNGGELRDRTQTVLGDIVDSSPMYVKDNQTIFVGANDGMLHAFNALTGVERFAYVPAGINLTDLASLSDPQYVHRWFVDGPVVVSTLVQTPSHNYLIASLGRGGNGVFGMDVTSPDSFDDSAGRVWDRTWAVGGAAPAGFGNMGQVLGEPLVVKLNNGVDAALVPNGYNSATGTASLFVLDMSDGSIIKEINTAVTGGNGLSAPRGWDYDGNGTVDYVYAGDLQGNLWKFDFSGSAPGNWKVANGGSPMFVAMDATNKRQPITSGLALAKDPKTSKRWVFIGTGSFMTNADVTDMSTQSMYGVIDDDTVVKGRTSANDGDLAKHGINLINGTGTQRGFEPNAPLAAGKKGWYIDLLKPPAGTQEGERIVSRPQVRGSVLITASLIPPTNDTCSAGGRGYINALDAFSGTSLPQGYFDADGDGDFDDTIGTGDNQVPVGSVDLGVGMPTLPTIIDNLLVVGGSTGTMGSIKVNPQSAGARRLTWREILRDQ
jgi:type IV pilus assembly protein PilY1